MNLRRLCSTASAVAGLAAATIFAGTIAAQNPAGGASSSATAQPLPLWAYPVNPPSGRGGRGPGGGGAAPGSAAAGAPAGAPAAGNPGAAPGAAGPPAGRGPGPDSVTLMHVPDSTAGFTKAYIANLFTVPDWFPDSHPALPEIVATGNKTSGVQACGYCHLPNGEGRPENESVVGLPAGYILQQISDFKNDLRKSSEPRMGSVALMVRIGKGLADDEAKAAAAYFSSIKPKPWIRVVEQNTVPATHPAGGMLNLTVDGGTEPIGARIIEVPEDLERTELRDSTSGFVAYVPVGSIKKGHALVSTGGNGETIRCSICHGADLKGLGNVPSIAGRSPSQMVRQIMDIQSGVRNGPYTQLMKEPVRKLTNDDIVAITAYLASLAP